MSGYIYIYIYLYTYIHRRGVLGGWAFSYERGTPVGRSVPTPASKYATLPLPNEDVIQFQGV
jgi:hypothetical protein